MKIKFRIKLVMLYRAKQKGKNRYIVYAPEIHGDVLNGETEVVIQNTAARRQDKEDLVLAMIEYLAKQKGKNFTAYKKDGKQYLAERRLDIRNPMPDRV